ncbi:hypothetical protein [Streptomyces sp. NPDC002205]|uniref:hypothetical protein n=1 Tax=Streptomyces sp. NPDC002205 TaxID=3154411 RepID=UPI00332E1E5C
MRLRGQARHDPVRQRSLEIGPSAVAVGKPVSSCTLGAASEVTLLLPDGRLRRESKQASRAVTHTEGG